MNKKALGGILAVIIVALAVVLGYYVAQNKEADKPEVTPTSTPTAELKKWNKDEMQTFIEPIMHIAYSMDEFSPDKISDDTVLENCIALFTTTDLRNELDQEKINSLKQESETLVMPSENISSCASRYYDRTDFKLTNHKVYQFDTNRNVYFVSSTFGYTGGPLPKFEVTELTQKNDSMMLKIHATYSESDRVVTNEPDTDYEAVLKCDNETCHVQSIKKK